MNPKYKLEIDYDIDSFVIELGEKLKKIRTEKGLSYYHVSKLTSLTQTQIERIEKGEGTTLKSLIKLSQGLGIDVRELFIKSFGE